MIDLLLRDCDLGDRHADVRIRDGRVIELGSALRRREDDVIDADGRALLPGLHEHHVHLAAMAAAASSIDVTDVGDRDAFASALSGATDSQWLRVVGYHDSIAGRLDRWVLDTMAPGRAVRVQHRSGGLWILSSRALEIIGDRLGDSPDVERDEGGCPTGRLWRLDSWLRTVVPPPVLDWASLGRRLDSLGITSVTDATPELDDAAAALLSNLVEHGVLPPVTALGVPVDRMPPDFLSAGPCKIHIRDHDLPTYDELAATIADAHRLGRPVAVHVVTRVSLVLTLAVLEDVGSMAGDRLEHCAVVPPDLVPVIHRLGLAVVTQPDFLRTRGDDYLREVARSDLPYLYPHRSLLRAGIPVVASSDAPHGELDPWQVIAAATARRTRAGAPLGLDEAVSADVALAGYLSSPERPGGPPRLIRVGTPADVILLDRPLVNALGDPSRTRVDRTWRASPVSTLPTGPHRSARQRH